MDCMSHYIYEYVCFLKEECREILHGNSRMILGRISFCRVDNFCAGRECFLYAFHSLCSLCCRQKSLTLQFSGEYSPNQRQILNTGQYLNTNDFNIQLTRRWLNIFSSKFSLSRLERLLVGTFSFLFTERRIRL